MRRIALLGCSLLALACDRGLAGPLAPDFTGTWDVTYDDSIAVEVQRADTEPLRGRVGEQGGPLAFSDAGAGLALEVDCARPDLVCPSEVWPRELSLQRAPGKLDDDGAQLAQPLEGLGTGPCAARPGSYATGELLTTSSTHAVQTEAVAIAGGRMRVVVTAACVAPRGTLPPDTEVVLISGFTAAKR